MLDGPADHGYDSDHCVPRDRINGAAIGAVVTGHIHPIGAEQSDAQYDCDAHRCDFGSSGSRTLAIAGPVAKSPLGLPQQGR
jgi:hypothetical protein